MIRSTRLLDLSGLVLDKRNPSSMAIQLVHHNVAAGQSDKVNVFCQGCHDYVGEQECDVLRAKLTPQVRVLLDGWEPLEGPLVVVDTSGPPLSPREGALFFYSTR